MQKTHNCFLAEKLKLITVADQQKLITVAWSALVCVCVLWGAQRAHTHTHTHTHTQRGATGDVKTTSITVSRSIVMTRSG